jgi:hypothetical protein
MKAVVVLPDPAWPKARLEQALRELTGRLGFLAPFDLAGTMTPLPDVDTGLWSGRRAVLSEVIEKAGYDLVIFLQGTSRRFVVRSGPFGQLIAILGEGHFPSIQELEDQLLSALYGGDPRQHELATLVLQSAVEKSPVIALFQGFRGGSLEVRLMAEKVRSRFSHRGPLSFVADSPLHERLARDLPNDTIRTVKDAAKVNGATWILIANRGEAHLVKLPVLSAPPRDIHVAGPEGYLVPMVRSESGALTPQIASSGNHQVDEHVFVRMCNRATTGGWYLFPYGFGQVHANGVGPIDSFGFRRAATESALTKRGANHRVVAVFGGSAVHGLESPHHETFPAVLETLINAHPNTQRQGLRYSVVNFGMSGHMQLNEIMTYIMFCHDLRPEIVIANDGFNDLVIGVVNDPVLIGNYQIAYPPNFEQWAQLLHGASHVKLSQEFSVDIPVRMLSSPQAVVRAYHTRKTQFARMVAGDGARFIWGLQPASFGKRLSANERAALDIFLQHSRAYKQVYERLPALYELSRKTLELPNGATFVDVHSRFGAFTEQDDLFSDVVHMTSEGNRRIAEIYTEAMAEVKLL